MGCGLLPGVVLTATGLLDPFWVGRRPYLFDQGCRRA
jgi:hypothetical protein